jgi:hypothetical protein
VEDPKTPDLAAVMKRLEALETAKTALEAENKALRRDQVMLMSAPAPAQAAAQPPAEPVLSYDNLPDPVADLAGYQTQLAARQMDYQRRRDAWRDAQNSTRTSDVARVNNIQAMFQEKYPHIDLDLAKLAAEKVISRLAARGVDTNRYVNVTTDLFFEDVVAEHGKFVAKYGIKDPKAAQEGAAAGAADPNAPKFTSPEEEFLRTGGIAGGQESGNAVSGATKEPDVVSIGDILDAAQAKTGLWY